MTHVPGTLPPEVAAAAKLAADTLFNGLHEHVARDSNPPREIRMLWQTAKFLNFASGQDGTGNSVPEARRHYCQWSGIAEEAADVVSDALAIAAAGMTAADAAKEVEEADILAVDEPAAWATTATVELVPPDYDDTMRTLKVDISGSPDRALSVTSDRGPAPVPRPWAPAALLQAAHHLRCLAALLGGTVLEPWEDGVPACGDPDRQYDCAVCTRTVGGDVARIVQAGPPDYRKVTVCSVQCARAAHAGETAK